ncbi:hypothetical protein OROHE_006730 [Orobanche hederae]
MFGLVEKLNGLRKVRNDEDIRHMQEDMKNETSMKIWIEELSKSETGNPPPSIDDNGEHQLMKMTVVQTVQLMQMIIQHNLSDEDEQFAEDFEGPEDDDIFVKRPENHSQNEQFLVIWHPPFFFWFLSLRGNVQEL